ncbi:c6 zinc finger domain protein [Stemphylium lycopersici]|nr:c6 zinc finger domain protein [Stemphylium lycopersici]RAR03350.1 c6 zinc finger domain protein [Stemphylium lycopersici]
MTEQRVAKRKTHTKSRRGCFQCKQRHTKCNEARPRCANCVRLDIHCTFPTIPDSYSTSPQHSPGVTSPYVDPGPPESPDASSNGSELPLADLRLLHHWTKTCAKSLFPNPGHRSSVWQNEFIELGFEYPFLLRGFLALSAVHQASLLSPNDRQVLLHQADAHISRALDTYRKNLETPKVELAIPMFMLSSIILTYNFGSAQLERPEDPIGALHHCFMLLQGIKIVVIPNWEQIKDSTVFAYMTDMASPEALQALDRLAREENPQEILRLKELTELLLDSQDKEACAAAIDELHETWLRFRHLSPDRDEYSLLFLWASRLSNRFLDLLAAHNPVTCIITTHFVALLAQSRPVCGWNGRSKSSTLRCGPQAIPLQFVEPEFANITNTIVALPETTTVLLFREPAAHSAQVFAKVARLRNGNKIASLLLKDVAAIIFVVTFGLTTLAHIFQLFKKRTWYFMPLIIGGIFEVIGFIGRYLSHDDVWALGPFIMQSLLILLAPALFAASIYIILGRIILMTDGERYSLVRQKWLTKIFVAGDVLSFLMQGSGGGIQAGGTVDSMHLGEQIIIGGLFVQLIFFGLFIVVSAVFHYRLVRDLPLKKRYGPSLLLKSRRNRQSTISATSVLSRNELYELPWKRHLFTLYVASTLILIRSIFRVVEYIQGNAGYLLSNEVFLYVFDATLMLFVMLAFNWIHPSQVTETYQKRLRGGSHLELQQSGDDSFIQDEEQMADSRGTKNGMRTGGWTPSRG